MGERDKYLTEAMGYKSYLGLDRYVHPDKPYFEFTEPKEGINFSAWQNFGKLWEWSHKQEWFGDFGEAWTNKYFWGEIVDPDRFADAIYRFLKERDNG